MADQSRPVSMTPDQIRRYKLQVEQTYVRLLTVIDELSKAVGPFADRRWKEQLALYRQQRDERFTPQVQELLAYPDNNPFWSNRQRVETFAKMLQAFIDQVKATVVGARLGFWDDFLDTFMDNVKVQWEKIPDPTKPFQWLPWIVGALVLGPFILRSFVGYRRGGAEGAAEAAAGELERGRAATGRAIASGAKAVATRGASFME